MKDLAKPVVIMGNRPVKQKINIVLMVVFIYVNCLLSGGQNTCESFTMG